MLIAILLYTLLSCELVRNVFVGTHGYDPLLATCLFYTRGESTDARVFAHRDGAHFTTIWVGLYSSSVKVLSS